MRKGRTAKEGLMQYKNIAQNTSVQSIEVVINRFIQLADAKVQEAQEKADKVVAVDVDDLEASETPESILLGAVSGDQSKDRTDRALVTPWLKFLWESYRTALETLKNNARLEVVYQQIAQQAFRFCLKYQRKVEFRRLCETLRLHLSNVAKYAHQPHSINLSDSETLQHHLDTRFAQLNTSVELELWQEAFRSVEDIHNLLIMAKKAPRPAMMANYYEKLTKIFLMSGNALYHAAAWGRSYGIVTAMGGKSDEEIRRLAGQVLVSALAVPVGSKSADGSEDGKGKNQRLTALLGLNKTPTRQGLLKDALSRNVLKLSPEPIKQLYNILEVTFDPLTLCSTIAPLFQSLQSDASYSQYLPLLQHALLSRLLLQLSQVYSSIKVDNLLELIAPLRASSTEGSSVFDEEQIEAYVMGCARRGELNIRVDHSAGSITFVDTTFSAVEDPSSSTTANAAAIQPSTSEVVKTRLNSLATCLHNSLATLFPPEPLSEERQQAEFAALMAAAQAERKALQVRRAIVARRRELGIELAARKEKEETSRRAELSRKEKEEQERRRVAEARQKEVERARKEIEAIRTEEARKLAQSLKEKGTLKVDVTEMENLSTDNLMRLQVEQLEKEKRGLNEKMRIASKRIDHVERAYRKEERPLLAMDYEVQQANDKAAHEAAQKARVETARLTHQKDLETKKRLLQVMDDWRAYREVVAGKRGEEFTKHQQLAQKKIEEEKAKRRAAILKEREEERLHHEEEERLRREQEEEERQREEARLAEEERVRAEEEAAKEAEEAKKLEAEEKAASLRKEREAERQAALEQARLQQQREEEAEQRRNQRAAERERERERERLGVRAPPARAAPVPAPAADEGAWRRGSAAPSTPSRAPAALPSEIPATGKYRPGAFAAGGGNGGGGGGGGWRAREAVKKDVEAVGSAPASRPESPAPKKEEVQRDTDGFQTVAPKGVWRPKRGRA
ncbi:uncharacterized protein PHACADRAFT_263445 [Phanerochaete carnosa HHB-10118-sp]|uniref:Eukaryotic translation initiation factor 3 subunit A n=1 Tax=Phanerochaete carnosa (strain HHB-10118-sp) TaxID=650164 RepID=K5VX49_PHACS|nr:uncharacterized protein PHACADRAFT_263445 [Phanerochaete carnosa HHB-10118-sp]EKM51355.1 hypothetical protein PHACADRAFT_263445 [Phanerochaete carnosa HHB-10118-sp]